MAIHFTKQQIDEIEQALIARSKKDSSFPGADALDGTELIPIVQGGVNKITTYSGLWNTVVKDLRQYVEEALASKVDVAEGKQLSTEDYTTEDKSKLSHIEVGAQVNVNADWNATIGDAFIVNKPDLTIYATKTSVGNIVVLIPSQASINNQLADKAFVGSSVATNSAEFKGTYNSLAELQTVAADINDYGFVVTELSVWNSRYDRYKYNGTDWLYEYTLFSSPISFEPTTDPSDEEMQDEYTQILERLYVALTEAQEAKRSTIEAIENASDAADEATDKAYLANTAAANATAAMDSAKGNYNSLAERLSAIEGGKQDVISDLSSIRSGSNAGATAVQPAAISDFITRSVNDLVNYYTKSEVYTQAEVNALIAALHQFHYEVYTTLPQSGDSSVLYLIGPTGSGSDKYEEYVYSNGSFVKIGDTSIDLSNYATLTALNTGLAQKQDVISDLSVIRSGASAGATAYQKPSSGIPATDMVSSVQASLSLADSAVQFEINNNPASLIN